MNSSPLDLSKLHGRASIALHNVFPSGKAAGEFLRDYAFNQNRAITRISASGNLRKWACADKECAWFVWISRKRSSYKRASKLGNIPADSWYVSKINPHHTDLCSSSAKCNVRQLQELRGFRAAIVEGGDSSRLRVIKSVKTVGNRDIGSIPATVYRGIRLSSAYFSDDREVDFKFVPSFLQKFQALNTGTWSSCQLDDKGRFFRAFLSIGSVVNLQDCLLPVFECDGTHMKHAQYNGVCLSLTGKDGDGKNIPLAVAYVPKETVDSFVCFFANCFVGGLRMNKVVTFSDRGKQRSAQLVLARLGFQVNLKFCALHIKFNVKERFKDCGQDETALHSLIFQLQAAPTISEYDKVIKTIDRAFPKGTVTSRKRPGTEESVSSYLAKLHPTSWAESGNGSVSERESDELNQRWSDTPAYGDSLPLFGYRTTSGNEGENNAMLWDGRRDHLVFKSLLGFCSRAMKVTNRVRDTWASWAAEQHTVTPKVKVMYDEEIRERAQQTVQKSTESVYYVRDPEDVRSSDLTQPSLGIHEVDLVAKTCKGCRVFNQIQIPCRHILAAIASLPRSSMVQYPPQDYFHPAYRVATLHAALSDFEIRLPADSDIDGSCDVLPPPMYKQAGMKSVLQARKMRNPDRMKRQKRFLNKGERRSGNKVPGRATSHTISPQLQPDSTMEDTHFLEEQITAAIKKTGSHTSAASANKKDTMLVLAQTL